MRSESFILQFPGENQIPIDYFPLVEGVVECEDEGWKKIN